MRYDLGINSIAKIHIKSRPQCQPHAFYKIDLTPLKIHPPERLFLRRKSYKLPLSLSQQVSPHPTLASPRSQRGLLLPVFLYLPLILQSQRRLLDEITIAMSPFLPEDGPPGTRSSSSNAIPKPTGS